MSESTWIDVRTGKRVAAPTPKAPLTKSLARFKVGDRIWYSGDMCNDSGEFAITAVRTEFEPNYNMAEVGGDRKMLGILDRSIGDKYEGHCNPRFVPMALRLAWLEGRSAESAAAINTAFQLIELGRAVNAGGGQDRID